MTVDRLSIHDQNPLWYIIFSLWMAVFETRLSRMMEDEVAAGQLKPISLS